ncbi:hypothetical protein M409DRAFT_18962 [Zasmidium cellare ATCC 36951]|uniref:Uncharacterized protein n=1 Tax=Zasmidium cellare ATCC 36951 TaxID=1080233 RepID=A0A6A6CXQ8_ZASCE|nr:uncharacterized protein M409DRAFT_18962 [Zasmidium cellare ATCC 36951]KAF2170990.1 hypothetical protein M409DRAFT_18962 [Zasmidium cellare ATCC 36951]
MSAATVSDLGLTIPVYDVGSLLNKNGNTIQLKQNLLFITPSLDNASSNDNKILRENLGIKTVINTRYPQRLRYYKDDAGAYKSESCTVENVLGVTSCHVHLRLGRAFAEGLLKEVPAVERYKLNLKASVSTNRNDPKLVDYAQRLLRPRSRVEDGLAVLVASTGIVGHIFKSVVAGPNAFPLLLYGDGTPGSSDSSLILFLLLLVLDVPGADVERVLDQIEQPLLSTNDTDKKEQRLDDHWARELKHRLEGKYCSVTGYFSAAGVTEATKQSIREALSPVAISEKSGVLVDLDPAETQ